MILRDETRADQDAIARLTEAAFASPTEARLIDALRAQAEPFVSIVAERDGEIVGHIAFSPVCLDTDPGLILMGLGPMAVRPGLQRRGIGSALVREGLERCRALAARAVVVLGHPGYYPRFGFEPARAFGVDCEYDVPEEVFMLLELVPGSLRGKSGVVRYHAAFAAVEA